MLLMKFLVALPTLSIYGTLSKVLLGTNLSTTSWLLYFSLWTKYGIIHVTYETLPSLCQSLKMAGLKPHDHITNLTM